LSDLGVGEEEGRALASAAVEDGSALAMYERWIAAQGGDPREDSLPSAPVVVPVHVPATGFVSRIGAVDIGLAALRLGAGRQTKEDDIDHAVGILCLRKHGDAVTANDVIAEVHAQDDEAGARAVAEVLAAYEIANSAPPSRPIVLETIVS
jgi:pyrimidine-nucleoside phosphorylase